MLVISELFTLHCSGFRIWYEIVNGFYKKSKEQRLGCNKMISLSSFSVLHAAHYRIRVETACIQFEENSYYYQWVPLWNKKYILVSLVIPYIRVLDETLTGLGGWWWPHSPLMPITAVCWPFLPSLLLCGLHGTLQGGLEGLKLVQCLLQKKASHKLLQIRSFLIVLKIELKKEKKKKEKKKKKWQKQPASFELGLT